MKQLLNGIWDAKCIFPGKDGKILSLNASVPGNMELDLFRAGIEPDPYYSTNEYLYQKYEVCDWIYSRSFSVNREFIGKKLYLVFEGLNCIADIFIDGALIAHTENALIPHRIDISGLIIDTREHFITVHVHSALLFARNRDLPVSVTGSEDTDELTCLRMPAHCFGWDIMPRFLSAGMWRDVYLETIPDAGFDQVYYATYRFDKDSCDILCRFRIHTDDYLLDDYRVRICMDGVPVAEKSIHFVSSDLTVKVNHPIFWWPLGYGKQHLYSMHIELIKGSTVIDSRDEQFGIRKVEIVHKMAAGDDGEFLIKINDFPILAKGANWVPLDALHSRDIMRIKEAVGLFKECGCNIMRMWGGNVYENEEVYRLCDEYGIMIWQDFAMACSVYPQDDDTAKAIETEAVSVVRRLRNHPSVILWAGDNEVDECYRWKNIPYSENCYNRITREVLPRVIRENDPYRKFLPSSPFIDGDFSCSEIPEQHLWGPRAYYKDDYYKNSSAHFVSECGYHGCPAVDSLKRFIPEDELKDMSGPSWAAHNSDYRLFRTRSYDRNQLMSDQVQRMIGEVPENLDDFCLMSQFTQAEAKKFFVERTRLKKWRRTGVIWWNMIDGWPQISDSVVDWYYVKKRAFETIRRVQTPICVIADEISGWNQYIYLCNDSREDKVVEIKVWDAISGEVLFDGTALSPANENFILCSHRISSGLHQLLLMKWTVDGTTFKNHCLNGYPPFDKEYLKKCIQLIDEE